MNKRPTSITIISWLFISIVAMNLMTMISLMSSSSSDTMVHIMLISTLLLTSLPACQIVTCYTGLLIALVSGIFMLRGANWARYLYIIWAMVNFIMVFSLPGVILIDGLSIFCNIIIIIFLVSPKANAYFKLSQETPHDK